MFSNIAALTLGRREKGGAERTIINLDTDLSKEVVQQIKDIKEISNAVKVSL
jgi:hypothetical protein